jgi:hypothetical protein
MYPSCDVIINARLGRVPIEWLRLSSSASRVELFLSKLEQMARVARPIVIKQVIKR